MKAVASAQKRLSEALERRKNAVCVPPRYPRGTSPQDYRYVPEHCVYLLKKKQTPRRAKSTNNDLVRHAYASAQKILRGLKSTVLESSTASLRRTLRALPEDKRDAVWERYMQQVKLAKEFTIYMHASMLAYITSGGATGVQQLEEAYDRCVEQWKRHANKRLLAQESYRGDVFQLLVSSLSSMMLL